MTQPLPHDLAIDSGGDEFPVSGTRPSLSWKLPDVWSTQTGYELRAEIDGIEAPPVQRSSSAHLHISWPWRDLRSRETVTWQVRCLGPNGPSEWSAPNEFQAGLLDEDWSASWISPREDKPLPPGNRPAYELSRTFTVRGTVARARLYATALGVYEAYVNGVRAGTAELSPGSSAYAETVYAQAADVTDDVTTGANTLQVLLSDGWYRGMNGAFRTADCWGTRLAARLELHLEHGDGTVEIIRTGPDWVGRPTNITRADLMDGQTTDFTAVPAAAAPVVVDTVTPPPIRWSPAPPVRQVAQLPARSVTRHDSGAWIVDFGQNASGWIRLSDLGPTGTRTVIDYGEHLDATGDLTTSHLDSEAPGQPAVRFSQRDEVISSGRPGEKFEPRHTVHGFRYARLNRGEVPLRAADITMHVVHTDLRRTATFECSDDDINRLHRAADWSFRGNAVDVPTDCPTRERAAWTGDFQIFAPTAARLYNIAGFARKWLQAVRDDQLDDGRVVNISPDAARLKVNGDPVMEQITGSSGWSDAVVYVPWEIYETYGDEQVLEENWSAMVAWVDWALANAHDERHPSRVERSVEPQPHERYLWDGSFHWGEWLEPKKPASDGTLIDPMQTDPLAWFSADKGEVATAYLFRSLSTLAQIADVLDRPATAAHYAATAVEVREAWRTEFLTSDGRTESDTQASYVRALAFGLVPDPLRERAANRLVELIRDADDHLGTGFLSTPDLLPVLADTGHVDIAYTLLFQRSYPSWLGMLDRGATTIWENWDGVDETGKATGSLNHYSKGAVIRFLHTHTLGLKQAPGSVAWESFLVAPEPGPLLNWATGTFDSPQGTISVDWRIEEGDFRIAVSIPQGSTATIVLPGGKQVTSGPGRVDERVPLPTASADR